MGLETKTREQIFLVLTTGAIELIYYKVAMAIANTDNNGKRYV